MASTDRTTTARTFEVNRAQAMVLGLFGAVVAATAVFGVVLPGQAAEQPASSTSVVSSR